jgi:predicted PurR-regulated permease PerM
MTKRANPPERSATPSPGSPGEGGTPPAPDDALTTSLVRLHVWQIQAVRDVLFVAAIFAIVWAGYALRAVTVPLLVALLLAYLFEPLIARLCRYRQITRPAAVGGLLVVVLGTFVLVAALIVPLVVSRTAQLIEDVREGRLREGVQQLESYVPETLRPDFERLLELIPGDETAASTSGAKDGAGPDAGGAAGAEPMDEVRVRAIVASVVAERAAAPEGGEAAGGMGDLLGIGRQGVRQLTRVAGAVLSVGFLMFLIPFYFFFFSLWYPHVVGFGRSLLPQRNRARTLELLAKMDRVVAGFVRGRIVISAIMGVMLAIGWWICGVRYAVPLGLVIGAFCAVPYLGAIGIPAAVGLLLLDQIDAPPEARMAWWGILLWPTLVFAIVQIIEGYALTPLIAGKATHLDPVTILVAVLAGGSVLGVYGMLLAIPLAACGRIIVTEILLPRVRAWTRGEVADPLPIGGTSKTR